MSAELSAQTVYHAWNRCCKGTGLYHCAMAWQQQGVGVVLIEGRHGMAKPAAAYRNRTLTDHNARSPALFSVQPCVVVYTAMAFELTDEIVAALFAPNGLRHRGADGSSAST